MLPRPGSGDIPPSFSLPKSRGHAELQGRLGKQGPCVPWRKHRRFGGCGAVRFASVPGAGHPRWGSSVTHPGSASNGSQFLLLTSLLNFTLCAVFILARKSVKPDAMPLRRGLRGGSFSVHRSSPARGKPRRARLGAGRRGDERGSGRGKGEGRPAPESPVTPSLSDPRDLPDFKVGW